MPLDIAPGLVAGAIGLGLVHGIEPGHGWPVAASYALDRSNKWLYGFAASAILGVGHLVSSIAMVAAFFWAKGYFELTDIGWMNYVAGALLIALGIREYFYGHSHGGGHEHGHSHDHSHDHPHGHDEGLFDRFKSVLPFVGGHSRPSTDAAEERGLWGIAAFAFVLGFAHEEEFEIIAICVGSERCLELMAIYAITVVFGIVTFTLLLIAGYEHYEDRAERYAKHLPTLSAVVLVLMGLGFILGVF